jgi:hypothetical protein
MSTNKIKDLIDQCTFDSYYQDDSSNLVAMHDIGKFATLLQEAISTNCGNWITDVDPCTIDAWDAGYNQGVADCMYEIKYFGEDE